MSKLYSDWANIYDDIYQQLFDYDKDFAFYHNQLQQYKIHSVLELGCGTGHLARRFYENNYPYVGIDLSGDMLSLAIKHHPYGRFIQGDIRHFELSYSFDTVIITGRTISYLIKNSDILSAFTSISKVLKKGGILIFDAIDAAPLFSHFKEIEKESLVITTPLNEYRRDATNTPNLETGFTWDWATSYFHKINEEYELIGKDSTTLRAFTKDEITTFLTLKNFEVLDFISKESYTWQSFYCVARKVEV